jgi:LacI family transcriptional regulator
MGYRNALQKAGLQESSFFGCDSQQDTLRAIQEKLSESSPPTAFVTSNTLATLHVFSSLLGLGIKIPSEIAFVGFDDFELAALTAPPLTVIRQPAQEMGRAAASLLFERIERGELPKTGNRIVLPVEMVLRRSCGCKHRTDVVIPLSKGSAAVA